MRVIEWENNNNTKQQQNIIKILCFSDDQQQKHSNINTQKSLKHECENYKSLKTFFALDDRKLKQIIYNVILKIIVLFLLFLWRSSRG